nr:hypothetical protein [Tanacetum cinerariifolium]
MLLISVVGTSVDIVVIEFGDSYEAPQDESRTGSASESSAKKKGRTVAVTTKDMQKRRNDVKQYGNFKAEGSEILEQTFNRLQAIVSHLEFIDVEIEQDDLNQKFLTSLAPEWLITCVSPANADVAAASISHDTILEKTGKKITIQGTDVAGFDKSKVECFNCHKMGQFARECRVPRSQNRGRREIYKQGSKEEEQAPKALIEIDGVGWDWSYMANEEENHALVADEEAPIEFALMAKSSSSSENEVFDNSLCSKSCKKNTNSLNTKITNLTEALSDSKTNLYHYKLGLSQVEARLVEFKTQEIKFCKKIRGLEFDVKNKNIKIKRITNELEQIKKETESLDSKLTGFESASKDLDTLLGSQRSDKNKEGLGYNTVPLPAQVYSPPKKDIDLQNNNSSVSEHGESSESIMSKPMIKFVKAVDRPTDIKTNKVEAARKPSIKYAEMYRITHKSPKEKLLRPQLVGFGDLNRTSLTKGNSQNNIDDKGYWDSGCSRHMTGNMSYLSDYEPYDGGYVSFGQGGGKITGKGKWSGS